MLIKAGTYRFNDVLSRPGAGLEQAVGFTVSPALSVDTTIPSIVVSDGHSSFTGMRWSGATFVFEGHPQGVLSLYSEDEGWNYGANIFANAGISNAELMVGYGQTITIPNDSEVSAEFYEWFVANAVEQKQISGKWKFNDVLSSPSGLLTQEIEFTTSPAIDFDNAVLVDGSTSWTAIAVGYNGDGTFTQCRSADGQTLNPYVEPQGWNYLASLVGNEDFNGYGQTIDFGTEPQTVAADFYNWLTENANPVSEESPIATITYNGSNIASLSGGETATLKCKGLMMEDDVVVDVAEVSGESAGSVVTEDTEYPGCYYRRVGDEKEWVNPPMVPGTEYRTADRRNGKAVYTIAYDTGPTEDIGYLEWDAPEFTKLVRFTGVAEKDRWFYPLPHYTGLDRNSFLVEITSTYAQFVPQNQSDGQGVENIYFQMWYTKE